ncbi:hypothetical protein C0Q70_09521 [Pomacea canaliculata]|uniref:Uncharacterized protein n=1 Tax=Pomacea canaliculata TaxID=400727 RepID=A0A2T7PA15_POMCA|nr:hypothetical protein C0Q70_09521 [Pomacea canaliculata]
MEVIYANPTTNPYDLFATSRRSTCGKRAGTTTGNGTYANPYVINVDLSNGLSSQSPDCGVVKTGADTYTISISVVFSCDGPDPNDKDYTFSCNLNLPTTTVSPSIIQSSSANYSCLAPGTILFTYEQTLNAPGDVYAAGKEATCSRSAGQGSGSGASGDPYMLQIDVSSTATDCGVMVSKAG